MPDSNKLATFRSKVWTYYQAHGRDLPWRHTTDPYHILISEVMLQQTQVARVAPKYYEFLAKWPTVCDLAAARPVEVLSVWQGLDYNRRAIHLLATAQKLCNDYGGVIPNDTVRLASLPGIGQYTARAIRAFAFNHPVTLLETNIRSALLHEFFTHRSDVPDRELEPILEALIADEQHRPREWYFALMDYGATLKTIRSNPNVRSRHYVRQTPFHGSNREIRGKVMRTLLDKSPRTVPSLASELAIPRERLEPIVASLVHDRLIRKEDGHTSIVD